MKEINFAKVKKIYFIGIGGIGMSAVARMFSLEHKEVFGSDLSESEVTAELQKMGIKISFGTPLEKLPADIDLVIYTVAIPENHSQLVGARERNIPTISYPESLSIISKDKFTIAVAGTHGKTTTTAMIAKILIDAGLDPTVIVGSLLRDFAGKNGDGKSNFIAGKSKYFVVEACEYKRSFLNLRPNIAVVTNIDDDHLDYYKNLAGIQQGFTEFLQLVKNGGLIVTDTANEKVVPVIAGLNSAENQKDIKVLNYSGLDISDADIHLKIPGRHNIQNAKAALAVAAELGVSREKALASLASFSGTWRRFEDKGQTASGVLVYDDYAHHPSEIAATLQAAREKFPLPQRVVVAFQPHLYSRTKEHLDEFASAFALADEVLLLPIYAAREPADPEISSEIVAKKMIAQTVTDKKGKEKVPKILTFKNLEFAVEYVKKNLGAGDVLFTMGAGDITNLSEMVLK